MSPSTQVVQAPKTYHAWAAFTRRGKLSFITVRDRDYARQWMPDGGHVERVEVRTVQPIRPLKQATGQT